MHLELPDYRDSWSTGDQEYSVAVNTTVKTWSQGNSALNLRGREYLPDGTPTGASYVNAVGCCFRDGTTDGQFNHAIRENPADSAVYQFDLDWTNPTVVSFGTLSGRPIERASTGIAYDSSDDTFWLAHSALNVTVVQHVTRTGSLISSFGAPPGARVATHGKGRFLPH